MFPKEQNFVFILYFFQTTLCDYIHSVRSRKNGKKNKKKKNSSLFVSAKCFLIRIFLSLSPLGSSQKQRRRLKASLKFTSPPTRMANEGQSVLDAMQEHEYVVIHGDRSDPRHHQELEAWTERVHADMQREKLFKKLDGVGEFFVVGD